MVDVTIARRRLLQGAVSSAVLAWPQPSSAVLFLLLIRMFATGATRAGAGAVARGAATSTFEMAVTRSVGPGIARGLGGRSAGRASSVSLTTKLGVMLSVPMDSIVWNRAQGEKGIYCEYKNPSSTDIRGRYGFEICDYDTGEVEDKGHHRAPLYIAAGASGGLSTFTFEKLPYPGRKVVKLDVAGNIVESEIIYVLP